MQCVCLSLKPKLKGEAEAEERKQSSMVSTRRNSGSLSAANSSKRPSSSEDKPPSPSPKRQKVPICNAYSFSFSLFLASLSDSFRFFSRPTMVLPPPRNRCRRRRIARNCALRNLLPIPENAAPPMLRSPKPPPPMTRPMLLRRSPTVRLCHSHFSIFRLLTSIIYFIYLLLLQRFFSFSESGG